ncbi:unnamed protein product [Auanema sp. JU1783]|nr:unnamed protein product [Auanema sp. JU1783]
MLATLEPLMENDFFLPNINFNNASNCQCYLSDSCVCLPEEELLDNKTIDSFNENEKLFFPIVDTFGSQSSVVSVFNPYKYGSEVHYDYSAVLDSYSPDTNTTLVFNFQDEGDSIKKITCEPLKEKRRIKEEVFDSDEPRKKFARFRDKKFVCDVCEHTFTLKQNVAQHFYLYHHPRKESTNKLTRDKVSRYQCTKCDKIFLKLEQAKRHEVRVHGDVAILKEKKVFACDECTKVYPTNTQLRDHKRVFHQNIRMFQCNTCQMKFGRAGGLRRHIQMVHEQQLFKCPYEHCEHPGYKCTKALTAHIRSRHTFVRPFSCLHCDKSFVRKNDLKVHEQIHSLQSGHDCPFCKKTFKRSIYLMKHSKKCVKTPKKEECD